jgi:hypothetical protein
VIRLGGAVAQGDVLRRRRAASAPQYAVCCAISCPSAWRPT